MRFSYTFKHMESSQALMEYSQTKISEKVLKFVTKPIEAHLTFSVDKHIHKVHCDIIGGDGFNAHIDHESGDMYSSLDQLLDKLEVQLRKHKEKLKDHHKGPSAIKIASQDAARDSLKEESIDAEQILQDEKIRVGAKI